MAVEIEVKLKVDDLSPVREKLKALGAKPLGVVLETNIFFDTPDRALLAADCGLRLRRSRKLSGDGAEKLVISYKGPRAEGPVKRREEIEVVVDRMESVILLLERLGYAPMLTFEKRRESWQLGGCRVELDQLPQIGDFVEIECASEEDVTALQERLGLSSVPPVIPTYADLITRHLSDTGVHDRRLTFNP